MSEWIPDREWTTTTINRRSAFTGKVNKLTVKLIPPKRIAEQEELLKKKQEARNAAQ